MPSSNCAPAAIGLLDQQRVELAARNRTALQTGRIAAANATSPGPVSSMPSSGSRRRRGSGSRDMWRRGRAARRDSACRRTAWRAETARDRTPARAAPARARMSPPARPPAGADDDDVIHDRLRHRSAPEQARSPADAIGAVRHGSPRHRAAPSSSTRSRGSCTAPPPAAPRGLRSAGSRDRIADPDRSG